MLLLISLHDYRHSVKFIKATSKKGDNNYLQGLFYLKIKLFFLGGGSMYDMFFPDYNAWNLCFGQ